MSDPCLLDFPQRTGIPYNNTLLSAVHKAMALEGRFTHAQVFTI